MLKRTRLGLLILTFVFPQIILGGNIDSNSNYQNRISVGAARMNEYLPLLKDKRVAILTNQSAVLNGVQIVDTLLKRGVDIVKIFVPEHGFLGTANAGATISDSKYSSRNIPVISLYGKRFKPLPKELENVDIMLYDLQDVGVRYYTNLASMEYFMEAAAENHKPIIILDRPNPIGFYIDGPILDKNFKSLVGMQPVPIVYGMTIGEYAKMLIGEHWLDNRNLNPDLTVIKCLNYSHDSLYELPIKPSPNLHNMAAVYLYPSLCFFEGTACSVGRGTKFPFQLFGSPAFPDSLYSFVPIDMQGAINPKLKNVTCYGFLVASNANEALQKMNKQVQLRWILKAYELFPDKSNFFNPHFDKLAGSDELRKEIENGWSEDQIRKSWQPGLERFKLIRKKYLLYPDFKD